MKILYLHQYFNLPNMVGSTRSLELARGLTAAGYKVEVITSRRELGYEYPNDFDGISIDWLDVPYNNGFGYYKRLMAFLKFIFLTTARVLSKDYDLIYVSSTPLTVIVPALIAKVLKNKEFILEVRDMWPEIPIAMGYIKSNLTKYLTKRLAHLGYIYSEAIIALSNDMAKQIIHRYNLDAAKVFVLPNFSYSNYFQYNNSDLMTLRKRFLQNFEHKIIIYPGTFGHVNGVDYIVSLAEELRQTKYFFLAIGSGKEMKKIHDLVTNKKLNNLVVMESVPKDDIFKYIAASDYLISTVINVPELNWNSANKYFDGLCAGKPIIINHEGWQAQELCKWNSGIVLERDIKNAAEKLKSITDEHYYLMKSNAIFLSKKYEKDKIQNRLIKILQNDKEIPNMY